MWTQTGLRCLRRRKMRPRWRHTDSARLCVQQCALASPKTSPLFVNQKLNIVHLAFIVEFRKTFRKPTLCYKRDKLKVDVFASTASVHSKKCEIPKTSHMLYKTRIKLYLIAWTSTWTNFTALGPGHNGSLSGVFPLTNADFQSIPYRKP